MSTISTREADEATGSGGSCGICRRQVSRYACPACNLCYCSLSCFRSELHSQCSETFYRKEIEMTIQSGPPTAEGEKKKTLELLQRIQDEGTAGGIDLSDSPDEEDSLAHRFSAVDISSASADDIVRLLSKEEKDKFFAALKDPSSELVRELLGSMEFEQTRRLPWWEAPCRDSQPPLFPAISHGVEPELMTVPANLVTPAPRGASLLYNICVVLLAYSYVTRHLSMSPLGSTENDPRDQHEARKLLLQTAPFLAERKSKLLHLSLTDAVISFWSKLSPGSIDKKAILLLLEDAAKFVRPRRIVTIGHFSSDKQEKTGTLAADHPFASVVMVISDICSLFSAFPSSSAVACQRSHVVMKLTFYAAHILSSPSSRLHALADEVQLLLRKMGREES